MSNANNTTNTTNTTKKVSRSERTNAKNLEKLHIAAATVETVANYNPVNPLITKTALAEFEAGFAARMQATNAAVVAEDTAVEAQTAAFKAVRSKVTRIKNAVKGQGVAAEAFEHLMTTVRHLRGSRVNKKTPDQPPPNETLESAGGEGGNPPGAPAPKAVHSVSQQSIAGILESLDLLDEQLKALTGYKPNEPEFQSATISAWIEDLRGFRNDRLDAQAAAVNSRHERDDYLYGSAGLIIRMNMLKAYVETILDKSDARYKKIKGLEFVDNGR
jgi:hypothetical protein